MNAFLWGFLFFLGVFLHRFDAKLHQDFNEQGWEIYKGPDVDFPENTYSVILIFAALYGFYVVSRRLTDKLVFNLIQLSCLLITLSFGLVIRVQDGAANMEESKLLWGGACVVNFLLGLLSLYWGKRKSPTMQNILDAPIYDNDEESTL